MSMIYVEVKRINTRRDISKLENIYIGMIFFCGGGGTWGALRNCGGHMPSCPPPPPPGPP